MAYSAGPYGAALADGSEYDGSYADRVTEEQLMDFHAKRIHVSGITLHHSRSHSLWTLQEGMNKTSHIVASTEGLP